MIETQRGQFRLHINSGGHPAWCKFDYAISDVPSSDSTQVVIGPSPDADTTRWFPDLKRGIERELSALLRKRQWCAARIEIMRIYAHPLNTTARACEYIGSAFASYVIRKFSVPGPAEEPSVSD